MKEYGQLLGTPEARSVQRHASGLLRVGGARTGAPRDAARDDRSWSRTRATSATCRGPTARSEPCSAPAYDLLETDDDGLCCGAGGAYAALQPELSGSDPRPQGRRAAAGRRRTKGAIVASANPGCMMHLRGAGLDVRHPADLLAEALDARRTPYGSYEGIAERLAAIEEELRDLAYERLRAAARDPDSDAGEAAERENAG